MSPERLGRWPAIIRKSLGFDPKQLSSFQILASEVSHILFSLGAVVPRRAANRDVVLHLFKQEFARPLPQLKDLTDRGFELAPVRMSKSTERWIIADLSCLTRFFSRSPCHFFSALFLDSTQSKGFCNILSFQAEEFLKPPEDQILDSLQMPLEVPVQAFFHSNS